MSQGRQHNKKITVCQILHSLNVGGAEMLAARLARRLSDTFEFVFVCLDRLGTLGVELRREKFRVDVLGRQSGLDWRCAWKLAGLLRRRKVDVIHAHQYTPFFYALMGRLISRRPPILFTEHGRHFPDYPRRKRMLVNRLLLERRDRVVGVGEAVRRALIANEGFPADRVQVVYNGIPLTAFSPIDPEIVAIRRDMNVEPGDFVILMVARLDYLKDHATAIRTLHRVVQRLPQARLVLAGEGPEREKIQALVSQLQLGAHVRFLGLRQDIPNLLAASELFVLTSISEGIPLTIIEAMAASLPIVATDVGGMGEVVETGTTGLLAPAGDDAALAEHIIHLAQQGDLRHEMGRRGRKRATELFAEDRMNASYSHLYQEMARG